MLQHIRAYEASIGQLRSIIVANEQQMREVVSQEGSYAELVRRQDQYQEQYEDYRRDHEEAIKRGIVTEREYGTKVDVYAPALKPTFPYRRPQLKMALMCLVAGVAAGIAMMFGLEFCDRSLRNMEDAGAFLKMPVLASIPTIVTPQQLVRRRRWRLAIAGVVAGLVLASAVALFAAESLRPGTLYEIKELMKQLVR